MAWNNGPKPLPSKPFTGMLEEVDIAASRAEGSVNAQIKLGLGIAPGSERTARAMRAIERLLVALEPYWNAPLPDGKSVKQVLAEHEAVYARRQAQYVQQEAKNVRPAAAPADPEETDELED